MLKTYDPQFVDRVIARVRQGEISRRRRESQVRILTAATTVLIALFGSIMWLGGFNDLRAQWKNEEIEPMSRVVQAPIAPPFAEHDPFAVAPTSVPINLSSDADEFQQRETPEMPVLERPRPPIPDYLSHLMLGQTASSPQQSAELAQPASQQLENSGVQVILSPTTSIDGPSLIAPVTSAPNITVRSTYLEPANSTPDTPHT